jgi:tetratricopeptide (TPR) repeat protein
MLVILALGCGTDDPEYAALDLVNDGWQKFEGGMFCTALKRFESAIEMDPSYGDAYNGKGWAAMRVSSLEIALSAFDEISNGQMTIPDPVDVVVGKAIIYGNLDPTDPEATIALADSALKMDPAYEFTHDRRLTWHDLRIILARSYFALGQYDEAKAQIDILKPYNELDPDSPRFVADLLAEIEELTRRY